MVMPVNGNSGIRAHYDAKDAAGTFFGFFFYNFGRGITILVNVSRYTDDFLGADRDAKIATLTPFGINDNIS